MTVEDCNQDDVLLLPQDYEAAKKHVLNVAGLPELECEPFIRLLARRHAALGPRLFRITLGLEPPRHSWEQAQADLWRQQISREEFDQRCQELLREPLTEDLLKICGDDMDECLIHYNRLFSAAQFVIDNFRKHGYRRDLSDTVSWHAREAARPTSLLKEKMVQVGEWALECRVSRGLPNAVAGILTSATAILLCCFATRRASELWFEHLEEEHRLRSVDHEVQLAAFQFLRNYYGKLPGSDELQSLMLQEVTIMKQELRKSAPPTIWNDEPPLVAHVDTDPGARTTVPSKPKTPVLSNWAFGYDGKIDQWWLFHRSGSSWRCRTSVGIPRGYQTKILRVFAENEGRVHRSDLLALFALRTNVTAKSPPEDRLDQEISKLRSTLRNAIPGFSSDVDSDLDPLPLMPSGHYIASVEVGWVRPQDNAPGEMEFSLQSDL